MSSLRTAQNPCKNACISRFLRNFAFEWGKLRSRHIRNKKKRYAYLEVGNVGNSRLFREKGVMVLARIAWAAITISLNKGYSYDLRLRTWHCSSTLSVYNTKGSCGSWRTFFLRMKKHLFLLMLSAAILAGCSKDEGGDGDPFTPPTQEQLTQNAYADDDNTGGGFSFTASAPWTATVNEVQAQALAQASVQAKSVMRAADDSGNNVVWLKLYNGNTEAYSGGAGTITLRIEIDQNYTGERREATITIRSGGNTFTVTVVQEGTKQDGSENEPPVKVTKITLDKTELSLDAGAKATLTATVEPADATIKSVSWSSSNPAVADVNPVTGEITAIADGTATVTATSSSNKEISASCKVTVGSDDPVVPTGRKLISRLENSYWYYSGVGVEEDGKDVINCFYDNESRLTKMVFETYSEADEPSPASAYRRIPMATKAASTRTRIPVTITAVFTYGDRNVSYEITREENGVADPYKDTGSVELDEAGRAVSGKALYYIYEKGTWEEFSSTYNLSYNDEGYLVKSVSATGIEERITWTGGNPTEVWWGTTSDGEERIDKASYGTVPNKTNLDLNWFCVLESEGWAFATGDEHNLFSLIGLTGKRSTHMAKSVTISEVIESSYESWEYIYQTDADGLPTKITQKTSTSYAPEPFVSYETVITYTE